MSNNTKTCKVDASSNIENVMPDYAFYRVFASSPFIKRGLPYCRQARLAESCGYSRENMEVIAQKSAQARNVMLSHCDTISVNFFYINYMNTIFYVVTILDSSNVLMTE